MKKYYRLLNHEFLQNAAALALICLGTVISPLFFINNALQNQANIYERFETIYASSGCIIVFSIYFACVCGICIKSIYSNYFGSKSIYTLITLPVKREAIYFSKLGAFLIYFSAFISSQLVSVFLCYQLAASKVAGIENGRYLMKNGLFLAFVRSDFLRILLPLDVEGIVSTISILAAVICGLYYGVLCERSRKYWGFVFVAAAAFIIISAIGSRTSRIVSTTGYGNTYIYSALLLMLSGFYMWHSIRLIKKGAVA